MRYVIAAAVRPPRPPIPILAASGSLGAMRILLALLALPILAPPARADDGSLEREVSSYLEAFGSDGGRDVLAAARGKDRWAFDVAFYLWASGIDGDVGARGVTVPVDAPFDDILDNLDGALMLHATARKGRWGIVADVAYIALEDDTTGALGEPVSMESEVFIGELAVSYGLVDMEADKGAVHLNFDVYAGARAYSADTRLALAAGTLSQDGGWVDPIVGFEAAVREGKWIVGVRGDAGGFGVGSDLSWSLLAVARFQFTKLFSMGFGYRWLDIDYTKGSGADAFTFDAQMAGPVLAFVLTF